MAGIHSMRWTSYEFSCAMLRWCYHFTENADPSIWFLALQVPALLHFFPWLRLMLIKMRQRPKWLQSVKRQEKENLRPQWRTRASRASIAMMECVRLIIGGDREKKGERGKRSVDRLIQNNLGGREGTAVLGTKRGRSRRVMPTPPAPALPSKRSSPPWVTRTTTQHPKPKRVFEVAR